ncbi:MAG: hypothetical protein HRU01_19265 [Myxococcales bacterium]|nr:hypothetical protein [Myxococcales bacterium]
MILIRTVLRTSLALATLVLATAAPHSVLALQETAPPSATSVTSRTNAAEEIPMLGLQEALVLEDREGYNGSYLFGMTRAIVNSTLHPAVKPLVFVVTLPVDLALLPFAAIAGFF